MTQIPRDGRKYEQTNKRTNEHMNIRTDEWKDENYIPLGINAGGIMIINRGRASEQACEPESKRAGFTSHQ